MSKAEQQVSTTNYFDYLHFLVSKNIKSSSKNYIDYLNEFKQQQALIKMIPCAVYILDYSTQQYLFVSEECEHIYGWTCTEFKNMGVIGYTQLCHPDDFKFFSNDVFKKFFQYANQTALSELKQYRFSVNYRMKRKDGNYIMILQQYVVLETDNQGNPLITLGVCTDITAHALNNRVIMTVSKYDKEKGFSMISSDTFSKIQSKFGSREIEVLKQLANGFSSKLIAEKLNIKENTVRAHRRNLMEKANCKNVAELTQYALQHGLI